MAKKLKVQKSKKTGAAAKSKKTTAKKQSRPTAKASKTKKALKKSSPTRMVPMSKAAAAGASRGMTARHSSTPHPEETDALELEAPELDFEADDSAEEIADDLLPPEYGGEN